MAVRITYFVHGTTTDNERGIAMGWNPGELSPRGLTELKDLRNLVANERFDAIFSSDLKRAADSATIVFGDRYTVSLDERLRECNYGDLAGKPTGSFNGSIEQFIESPFPHGESYRDVEKRVGNLLAAIKEKYNEGRVAFLGHQGPQLALEVLLNGKTWEEAFATDWRKTKRWQPGWEYLLP
jgi:broad specificity phosphatase PhoE